MSDPFDQVNQFIESILAGQRPNRFRADAPEDMSALRAAARLAAERGPRTGGTKPGVRGKAATADRQAVR